MITTINEFKEYNSINEFFNILFQFRQIAHDLHLTKSNYAEHMALGEFYEELLTLIDDLFETYQGENGLLSDYKTYMNYDSDQSIITIFESFTKLIEEKYKILFKDKGHLLNIGDEIVALSYKALYKLKYLK